ncbi:MAG: ABC transporter ATP-binding protein [Deltaproteobacteria bacterium]|nr:ABC transporter ATP-binding protein [Deltaproteobacteria bacterium]
MSPLLETKKLTIRFGGLAAVNEMDFIIDHGETIGLIGPNGSGKTTFFNLLTGIYKPTEGEIRYCGESLSRLPTFKIAKQGVARTFQNNRLFLNLSVLDNVLVGMHPHQDSNWFDAIFRRSYVERETEKGVEKGLELLTQFSEELASNCYQRAGDLPQADRRKVEICRALASNPKLLLLDEPSAGMSPAETEELMEDIRKVRQKVGGIGIIIIEHDMAVIREVAERVIVLNYGRKIAEGTFQEVSTNELVLEAYLGREEKDAQA